MANRRMISSDIFEDDFIGSLSFFERLVWIGLFAVCADDQGRSIDNPAIIRAKVFPYDRNVDDAKVEAAMEQAARAGKVIRYEASNGTRLLQITKWWQYQTPSWASPSKYPAPDGWVDRVKYHTAGNKIITKNWDIPGGLHEELRSALHSDLNSRIEEDEVNVKGEVKYSAKKSSQKPKTAAKTPHPKGDERTKHPAIQCFRGVTGKYPPKAVYDDVIKEFGESPDGKKFADVFRVWVKRGFKPTNIEGLLVWYRDGIPEWGGNGNGSKQQTRHEKNMAVLKEFMDSEEVIIDGNQ